MLSVYSAMAVYAIAFIAFSIDLARRGAVAAKAADADAGLTGTADGQPAAEREPVGVLQAAATTKAAASTAAASAGGAGGAEASGRGSRWRSATADGASVAYGRSPALRVGVAMTVLAWLLHLTATLLRGFAAGRVPWANMYEFALTGTLIITTVFLIVLVVAKHDLRFLGTFVTGLVLVLLGAATVNFYVSVVPLPPALQSAWLVIHVFVATASVGFFALSFALSVVQLMQSRRESLVASAKAAKKSFLATLPDSNTLENLAYRVTIVGFILWTFTLMAGAIWAEAAWGRYWGWDTKEVWTFIIWVVYAGYIHARATRGWRGSRSAWLAIIGFSTVLFNFTVVNLFFKGLHAYSGLL
ncbi:c-type cytochrome biogenesis protein CcsB [Agromyces mediolanus]|uniref:C-type cytochrome biogenesis protein CcsB n=2 Tax=Agromyces mediolanus TaxID=41986 RepID=A0A918CM63_AGRME|nr:c-type cytochrome biogenesis protein CcsB [Agromyces mediolanus]GLJ72106.1 c-type cytochrome biogenesis protein CcsB [Agromyces mediolanus]